MTTATRGYGRQHVAERKRWARLVASGQATCARCGRWIEPGSRWHLDHSEDRTEYLGASHAWCNMSAGGHKSGRMRRARSAVADDTRWWSRDWFA